MSQTVRAEKIDDKNGVISLVSMFLSRVMILKLSKKVILFLQFCAVSARNLSILKQFTYMHLIVYYKMVLFIIL